MSKLIDVLSLPVLAAIAVVFFGYIWFAWLRNKSKRSLGPNQQGDYDDVDLS